MFHSHVVAVLGIFALSALATPYDPVAASKVHVRRSETGDSLTATCSAISPPPSGLLCGAAGNVMTPEGQSNPVYATQVTNMGTCKSICLHENLPGYTRSEDEFLGCALFTYDSKSKVCSLLNSNSTGVFSMDSNSTTRFFDQGCFQCSGECPQSQTTNALYNGGFELNDQLFGPWFEGTGGETPGSITSPGHNSANAYLCPPNKPCEIVQLRRLCANSLYTFSADIKDPSASPSLQIFVGGFEFFSNPLSLGKGWKTVFGTFQPFPGVNNDVEINIYSYGEGFLLDNVEILRAPSSFPTVGNSIVKNGGFESGSLRPWTFSNAFAKNPMSGHEAVTSPGLTEGKFKFNFHSVVLHVFENVDRTGPTLTQLLTTVPNKRYLISFDYLVSTNGTDVLLYEVQFGPNSWKSPTPLKSSTSEIRHFSMVGTAFGNETALGITFIDEGNARDHFVLDLDNIQVRELA